MRSRYARGRPSLSAIDLSETGTPPSCLPSSTRSRTPYSAFVVKITRQILPQGSEKAEGLCASSQPLRQTDPMEIDAKLDAIAERLEEARAAAKVISDGDPSAMA